MGRVLRPKINLVTSEGNGDGACSVSERDVQLILDRLPEESWNRFQIIHFSHPAKGVRWLGYVHRGRKEITVSPLPPGVRRLRFLVRGGGERHGAKRGGKLRAKRDILFDVRIDDLGRLQIIDEGGPPMRLRALDPAPRPDHTDFWKLRVWSFEFTEEALDRLAQSEAWPEVKEVRLEDE